MRIKSSIIRSRLDPFFVVVAEIFGNNTPNSKGTVKVITTDLKSNKLKKRRKKPQ
jgi:hypothetical protein